jgi:hypothetical protein
MTISAIPYAVLTLVIVGLAIVALGPVIDAMIGYDADEQASGDLPYSQQRGETISFLLMCWGALSVTTVFCVVIFLLMNGAQRSSGGV